MDLLGMKPSQTPVGKAGLGCFMAPLISVAFVACSQAVET